MPHDAAFFKSWCHTYRISHTETNNILEDWKNIITACRRGDHLAQCEAYKQSWRIIYPSVYNVLRNREEAEDVMQESILKGYLRLSELKDPDRYIGWQKQISLRMALNKLRDRKNTLSLFGDVEFPDEVEPEYDLMNIDALSVQRKIENMPEGYRLVIQLHLQEEMTHEEIGQCLGITASTSRSQYCRALTKLKSELIEEYAKQV